jgi:2-keto-4-pentenoate hydratase/2-oxohepta-3-ene-1,7-dioic acid hydratase in catechol pathway
MALWVRFEAGGETGFGTLDGEGVKVHSGDMFGGAMPSGETLALESVRLLTPCEPRQMVALWNNFHAMAAKNNQAIPEEPLWFLKSPSAFLATGETIRRPAGYDGPVVYEGELGIVIGRRCARVAEADIGEFIFGYTCINDVTAFGLLNKDPSFAQWTRCKSFDGFGVFGPAIATGLDPMGLSIRTVLNGDERQNYPVSDMIFPPHRLVSLISQDLTLMPGDVIACGTSVGVGSMKQPENTVEITIEGVGTLSNTYVN